MNVQSSPPGSPEELAAFAALQSRLPALFRTVFATPNEPRTVVIVPGLSVDGEVLAKVVGGLHYEERQLPDADAAAAGETAASCSTEHVDRIGDHRLLPRAAAGCLARRCAAPAGAVLGERCVAADADTENPRATRLLERIRAAIGDPDIAHLSVFNSTACERTLAVRLGIPLYGCDPALLEIGGKSGSRQAFREAGIPLPDGAEDLRDTLDLPPRWLISRAGTRVLHEPSSS